VASRLSHNAACYRTPFVRRRRSATVSHAGGRATRATPRGHFSGHIYIYALVNQAKFLGRGQVWVGKVSKYGVFETRLFFEVFWNEEEENCLRAWPKAFSHRSLGLAQRRPRKSFGVTIFGRRPCSSVMLGMANVNMAFGQTITRGVDRFLGRRPRLR
jgi:hypothetical protein